MASELLQQGSTSQTIEIFIADSGSTPAGMGKTGLLYSTAGLKIYYQRRGSAPVAITLATLASPTAAWSSGGFIEIDATNQPGRYRLDLPDAALATGVHRVTVSVTGANAVDDEVSWLDLVAYDPSAIDKTGFSLSTAGVQAIWDALTANLTTAGSVGKVVADNVNASIAAVKAKTDNLPAAPAAVSDVPTANANADALLDRADAIETGVTLRGILRLIGAATVGKVSIAGSVFTFRNAVADTKARVTATATGGARTSVTTDQT